MRTKQSFIPFNLIWCIQSFLIPFFLLPMLFPEIKWYIITLGSLGFYITNVLKQSYQDWLEWRIGLLEERVEKCEKKNCRN